MVVSPAFKLVFFSVLGLTVLSLIAGFVAVAFLEQTEDAKRFAETCSTTWKMGFGAIGGQTLQVSSNDGAGT